PRHESNIEQRRTRGFGAVYYRVGKSAIEHRWLALLFSFVVLAVGFAVGSNLKLQFFPKDLSHLAYISVLLPEDAPFTLTDRTAARVEQIVQEVATEQHRSLESLDTFVGGGAPRFWY